MNNVTLYKNRHEALQEAQKEVQTQEERLNEIFKEKILRTLWVIYRVSEKMNRKESLPIIALPEFSTERGAPLPTQWKKREKDDNGPRREIKEPETISFNASSITVTWERMGFTGSKREAVTETFTFPIEWLSLSTWDLAKMVRSRIKIARDEELKTKAIARRKEAEAEWKQAKADVEKLVKEAASFEKKLKKLKAREKAAKARLEEVEPAVSATALTP